MKLKPGRTGTEKGEMIMLDYVPVFYTWQEVREAWEKALKRDIMTERGTNNAQEENRPV